MKSSSSVILISGFHKCSHGSRRGICDPVEEYQRGSVKTAILPSYGLIIFLHALKLFLTSGKLLETLFDNIISNFLPRLSISSTPILWISKSQSVFIPFVPMRS